MSRFSYCLEKVLGHEGGLSNHAADKGGLTNFGVTQRTYDDFRILRSLPKQQVNGIDSHEVECIYGAYWKDAKCDRIPEPLDLLVFDCAINSGAGRALKLLQRALGINADGLWGPVTVDSLYEEIAADRVTELCHIYLNEREGWYHTIVGADPHQQVFLKGWLDRLAHLAEEIQ